MAMRVAVMDGICVLRLRGLGMDGGRLSVFSLWKKTCKASSAFADASVGMTISSSSDFSSSDGSLWGS